MLNIITLTEREKKLKLDRIRDLFLFNEST